MQKCNFEYDTSSNYHKILITCYPSFINEYEAA